MPASYALYFWREDRQLGPAEDSILDHLAEDPNLPGVHRISLRSTKAAFQKAFPDISAGDREFYWKSQESSFRVFFIEDECGEPMVIHISSAEPLSNELFSRIIPAIREAGCTRFESKIE